MSTPSLEKNHSYHDLTQYVNGFEPGLQLQKIRCMRHRESGNWLLELDFYPSMRKALWVLGTTKGSWGWLTGERISDQVFVSAQNPLALYLKSHFIGKRLVCLSFVPSGHTLWDFGEGYTWQIELKTRDTLEWTLQVPGKKPFTKELKLYPVSFFTSEEPAVPTKIEVNRAGKEERLLQNIREDLSSAKAWVTKYAPLCLELQNRPWLWHDAGDDDAVWTQKISELQESGLLPKTREASYLKSALDKLFNERSRQERKIEKAAARLSTVEEGPRNVVAKTKFVGAHAKDAVALNKHPGLKIEILPGLHGYLGRSARENELLFKWVRDRDYWFHVRGYSGTHLWILRSDLKLGKDDSIPQQVVERAAKIALFNSKLKNSGSGSVDFTEKRHLKKLKGEQATLKISKSTVLFVSLEEDFEKTLKWS